MPFFLSQRQAAKVAGLDRAYVGRLLDRLAHLGVLEVVSSHDGRRKATTFKVREDLVQFRAQSAVVPQSAERRAQSTDPKTTLN